jgi:hypothetical protein
MPVAAYVDRVSPYEGFLEKSLELLILRIENQGLLSIGDEYTYRSLRDEFWARTTEDERQEILDVFENLTESSLIEIRGLVYESSWDSIPVQEKLLMLELATVK